MKLGRTAITLLCTMALLVTGGVSAETTTAQTQQSHPDGAKLSKEQALQDIDWLIYTISEMHPNMFSVCPQAEFFAAADSIMRQVTDSVSVVELYRLAAPLVAMLGDGHTAMYFPYKTFYANSHPLLPLKVIVSPDSTLVAYDCAGDAIPAGAEVLSINGRSSREMVAEMMKYESGERYYFRTELVNRDFPALFDMLYRADNYLVEYRRKDDTVVRQAALAATLPGWEKDGKAEGQTMSRPADYSFHLLEDRNVAVMDFRAFHDPSRMKAFADSMFTTLRHKGIKDLIIDIRYNGGGNSAVGDTLLRYLLHKPFAQFGQILERVTPTTRELDGYVTEKPGWYHYAVSDSDLIAPLPVADGHFGGKVYLLVSHYTFSSATAFAWAFKHFGMGTVVGEESGGMNVCYGDVIDYTLPASGLKGGISYKRFWLYGSDERDIHGVLPDHAVPQAEAFKAALQLIEDSRRKDNVPAL